MEVAENPTKSRRSFIKRNKIMKKVLVLLSAVAFVACFTSCNKECICREYAEGIEVDGEPFIVYFSPRHEVNQGDAVYDVSIAIVDDADETEDIRVVDMIENKVLAAKHFGSTDNILDTYAELVSIAEANNYDIIGSPKEVLIKSFFNCDDEKDFITEIQLPIIEM